jgi:hypothetical protein
MKTALDIRHEGTLGEDVQRMRIDPKSLDKIMRIVTDLYSDRMTAVIREYSTNAWDSHVEAGITDPIEVELPGSLDPMFRVRDHGLGLTVKQVIENVGSYGYSSKDHSDDYNGQLGLGSKSGLTYTPQFTYVVVKNGVKGTVLITRDRDGGGAMKVLDTCATDEPNGVVVEIPVDDVDGFNRRARRFFSFWQRGTVLIDGEEPTPMFERDDGMIVDPDVVLLPTGIRNHDGSSSDKSYIIMGNVAYPFEQSWNETNGRSVVARVPIGCVDFTPSRESLDYTKRTRETLEDLRHFIEDNARRAFDEKVAALTSKAQALRFASEVQGMFAWSIVKYGGEQPPSEFHFPEATTWRTDCTDESSSWSKISRVTREAVLADTPTKYVRNRNYRRAAIFVTGSKAMSSSPQFKCKLHQYLVANNLVGKGDVIICDKPVGIDWWGDIVEAVVPVEDVKAMPGLPKDSIARRVRPKGIKLLRDGGYDVVDDLPDNVVCWIESTVSQNWRDQVRGFLSVMGKEAVYVLKADMPKFKRDYPDAPHFIEWVQNAFDALSARMTLVHGLALASQYSSAFTDDSVIRKMSNLTSWPIRFDDIDKVLDPKLATVLRISAKVRSEEVQQFASQYNAALDMIRWRRKAFEFRMYDEVRLEGPVHPDFPDRVPMGKFLNEFGQKVESLHIDRGDMIGKYARAFIPVAERQAKRYWVLEHLPSYKTAKPQHVDLVNAMYLYNKS